MNVVGYVRLSRDEDRENYASILTQQDIINDYAIKHNLIVAKMYIDDNVSGYSFNRPAFIEMKSQLQAGNIDVIISKDLSRIGRHDAYTKLFIGEIQILEKRLILPEEGGGYDSSVNDDDLLGIKTWYNEMYIKDISRKIKSNMRKKQEKGELIMGNLYGYDKDPTNKSKLIVNEKIRPIIKLIFKLYIEGSGYKKICNVLNENGYNTPSQNIKNKLSLKDKVFKNQVSPSWQTHNIARIIQNSLYTGTLTTHKRQNKRLKGKQTVVPLDEQYIFPDHHEAIISKDDFELAQQINQKRKDTSYRGGKKHNYLFSGLMRCGECNFAMSGIYSKNTSFKKGYECTQYIKYGRKKCVAHFIKEDYIIFLLKEFLIDMKTKYEEYLLTLNFEAKKSDLAKEHKRIEKELSMLNEELKMLFNQKLKDTLKENNNEFREIIEKSYDSLENDKKNQINKLKNRLEEIKTISKSDIEKKVKSAIELFDFIVEADIPDRKLIELIVDKIFVDKDRTIEFKLNINID